MEASRRAADRRTRTPPSPPARTAGALLLALVLVGCDGEPSAAQEGDGEAVVPSERSVVVERADRARAKGDSARPLTIIEISDFECPYCRQYYRETYPGVDSLYVETGKAQYIFVVYPNSNHPLAVPAAEAAYCAGAAGLFWPMHDRLFENQDEWTESEDPKEAFVRYATDLGVDEASFRRCLDRDLAAQLQVRDLEQVARARLSSTPFFIINNETGIQGARSLDRFRTVLDSLLEVSGEGGPE